MEDISFGEYIKNIRLEKNLSLREAANLLGISHSYLNKLEKGLDIRNNHPSRPNPEIIDVIASKYSLDYNYLMKLCGYLKDENTDEERDVSKLLEKTMSEIGELEGLMFHGEPIDYNDFLKIKHAIDCVLDYSMKNK